MNNEISLARLAATALAAGATFLIVATVLIAVIKPGPLVGLVIAAAALVGAVFAMSAISRRAVRRITGGADPRNPEK